MQKTITQSEFEILYACKRKQTHNSNIKNELVFNNEYKKALQSLIKLNYVVDNDNPKITKLGEKALKPFKVDNAIIKAAGTATRFLPLSLETPKGLLKVKNEILLERQINQLIEADVRQIILVVGYKAKQFSYLKNKYKQVKIVFNPLYRAKNNIESLRVAKKYFKNSYICSSDNYFLSNPFDSYVYSSYYSGVESNGYIEDFHMFVDGDNNIRKITHGNDKGALMIGHAYWNKEFSNAILKLIDKHSKIGDYDREPGEELFADNINLLPKMYRKIYNDNIIFEFDTLDELCLFDKTYIDNPHSKIINNICDVFHCKPKDLNNFELVKNGRTNVSFSFSLYGKKYIYRHPGDFTKEIISRKNEFVSLSIAKKIGIDDTLIHMDENEGWKISKFIHNSSVCDFKQPLVCKQAVEILKRMHSLDINVPYQFNPIEGIKELIALLGKQINSRIKHFNEINNSIDKIYETIKKDNVKKCFCHCDTCQRNWLISNDEIHLIDWECAAYADPGCDLGYFICDNMYNYHEAKKIIRYYCGVGYDTKKLRHFIGYVAIISYYWSLWALKREQLGITMGNSIEKWLFSTNRYIKYFNLYFKN